MTSMRRAIMDTYATEFGNCKFANCQASRISDQGYTADPSKTELTFEEFVESFFGLKRLAQDTNDFNSDWTFEDELDHVGEVLIDNIIQKDK